MVSVINVATNTVTANITGGGIEAPGDVAVTPNGEYVYVAQFGSDSVLAIIGALAVDVSPSFWTMDVGQSATFTADASGGSGALTGYQWYVNGSAQGGAAASTFNFVPASSGSYLITATVTNNSSETSAMSYAATVRVNASPTVSIAPAGAVTLNSGQIQTFTATASGGSGNYTGYRWFVNGVARSGAVASTFSYSAASAGTYKIAATVTDSLGATSAHSAAASVTVPLLFGAVDWIVVIVAVMALLVVTFAWFRRRRKSTEAK
jgi:YVTN family beta-propeller protein